MPYHADLRCSYFHAELNVAWFYEYLTEREYEIDFKPRNTRVYDYIADDEKREEMCVKNTISLYEHHLDDAFKEWVAYKVFGHKSNPKTKYDIYNDVYEFLEDATVEYMKTHPEVVMKTPYDNSDNEDEDSDEDEESSSDA